VGCLLGVVALTFGAALQYRFVDWDDPLNVLKNPLVVAPFAAVPWSARLLTPDLGYPVPVTVATYSLEYALFGANPAPFHATNVLLHLVACALLYVLGRRLGLQAAAALAATALFALHPVVAEPVSWVSGRKDLLAALFTFAAAIEFQRAAPRRLLWMSLFVLAVLAKPNAIFVPVWFVALRLIGDQVGERSLARTARAALEVLPAVAVALCVFAISLVSHARFHGMREETNPLLIVREAWYALGFHLGLVSFVESPCVKHFPASWPPHFEPRIDLLPIGALALAAAGLRVVARDRRAAYLAGLSLAVLAYLPSSNLLPLQRYLADSYVYLPLAGIALALGALLDRRPWALLGKTWRAAVALGFVIALGVLAWNARAASAHWKDDIALWSDAHARYPDEYRICRNLGNAYLVARRPALALEVYRACAARTGIAPFRKNIAIVLTMLGRTEEATREFETLARESPGDPVVRRYLDRLHEGGAHQPDGTAQP
jgi:hypothetical protein